MRDADFPFFPKDFIETKQGLVFAVVSYQPHEGKVGCFLRYVKEGAAWKKIETEQANQLLQHSFPQYLYQSTQFDASFHAVAVKDIVKHHRPEARLQSVLQRDPRDNIEQKLQQLIPILVRFGANGDFLGLTGSMLINQQGPKSDIDLVVFGRQQFQKMRQALKRAVDSGELSDLDLTLMKDNFHRRAGELSFDEFSWHEYRKHNKASIDGTKFDIAMVCLSGEIEHDDAQYQKQGMRTITTEVIDDLRAYDFPAVYLINDKLTPEVLSFTHTYVGQAKKGELIEISGAVECNITTGKCRLIVGSTREADGEYIKVINT
ncbi:MAG: putative nucleotidyltransferase [Methylophagaceae bacterium]|jgi:predicted nucleotidyltransferase